MGSRLKDVLKPQLDALLSLLAMTLMDSHGAQVLLERVATALREDGDPAEATRLLELLLDVGVQSSQTLATASHQMGNALAAASRPKGDGAPTGQVGPERKPALLLLLRLVHATSRQLSTALPSVRKGVVAALCELACKSKDIELGKLAAQALSTCLLIPAVRERTFEMLVAKLTPQLEPLKAGPTQHCALAVLAALVKREPAALGDERHRLLRRLLKHALPPPTEEAMAGVEAEDEPDLGDEAERPEPPAAHVRSRCTSQLLTVELLANEALSSASLLHRRRQSASPSSTALVLHREGEQPQGEQPQGEEGEHRDDADGSQQSSAQTLAAEVLQRLVATLDAEGRVGAAAEAGKAERSALRLAVAKALLKMGRASQLRVEATIGGAGWGQLAMCMDDPSEAVRAAFAKKVYAESLRPFLTDKRDTKLGAPAPYLVTRRIGLPPQYMTLLGLCAIDPAKEHAKAARAMLVRLVTVWRSAAEANKSSPNATHALPEVQLPWLIHVLAHHPQWAEEEAQMDERAEAGQEDDEGTLPTAQKCLDFYINACLAGNAKAFDLLRAVCAEVRASDLTT